MTTAQQSLVLLHGGAMSASSLRPIAERLLEFRCLIPDLRGHGARQDVPFRGIDRCADDIATFITKEVGGPVHIFGLSLGGYIALALLAKGRVPVQSAILSGIAFAPFRRRWLLTALIGLSYPLLRLKPVRDLAGRTAGLAHTGFMSDPMGNGWAHPKTVHDVALSVLRSDPRAMAKSNPVRTLYLAGANEPAPITRGIGDMAADHPNASTGRIRNGSHTWPVNDPDLAASIIRTWTLNQPLPSEVSRITKRRGDTPNGVPISTSSPSTRPSREKG
ncbi:MAG: alpha/beta hydrolase [Pseudomonadota bacterium]